MTFLIRKGSIARISTFKEETVAFLSDAYDDPDYPSGMNRFWHHFSLSKGHIHCAWKYSIADAWAQLGEEIAAGLDCGTRRLKASRLVGLYGTAAQRHSPTRAQEAGRPAGPACAAMY
jgi:hypothetical protein